MLVILLVAIADYLIGSFVGPKSDEDLAQGFVGYNGKRMGPLGRHDFKLITRIFSYCFQIKSIC